MELQVQAFLRSGKTLSDLESELGIKASEWGSLVNLNYNQIDSPKTHPIVMECRQLILEKGSWDIVFRSFGRFFNYGEALDLPQDFDYKSAKALDKIDGSIIGLVYYNGQWLMTTRGVIEGGCQVGTFPLTFKELFEQTVSQYPDFWKTIESLKKLGPFDYCYTFELTSPENRVVTPYTDRKLHLLTVRNRKDNFNELKPETVRIIAQYMGVSCPQAHAFTEISELVRMASNVGQLEEGFVCIDYSQLVNGSYRRMKVKNPAYLAIAHLKESAACSLRALLQLVIMGEASEFLTYFPEYKTYVEGLQSKWDEYRDKMNRDLWEAEEKKTLSRKDYALWVEKNCVNTSVMYQFLDGKINTVNDWLDSIVEAKGVKNFGKIMMGVLKIKDMEWQWQWQWQ
jgi:hypothetical protein